MPSLRPPRVYKDKKRKQYYIRKNNKRVYFPIGITRQKATELAFKYIIVKGKYHNKPFHAQSLNKLMGFTSKYADSPVIVNYANARNEARREAERIIRLQDEIKKQHQPPQRILSDDLKIAIDEYFKTHNDDDAKTFISRSGASKEDYMLRIALMTEEETKNESQLGFGRQLTKPPDNFKSQLKRDGLYSDQIAKFPYKKKRVFRCY